MYPFTSYVSMKAWVYKKYEYLPFISAAEWMNIRPVYVPCLNILCNDHLHHVYENERNWKQFFLTETPLGLQRLHTFIENVFMDCRRGVLIFCTYVPLHRVYYAWAPGMSRHFFCLIIITKASKVFILRPLVLIVGACRSTFHVFICRSFLRQLRYVFGYLCVLSFFPFATQLFLFFFLLFSNLFQKALVSCLYVDSKIAVCNGSFQYTYSSYLLWLLL